MRKLGSVSSCADVDEMQEAVLGLLEVREHYADEIKTKLVKSGVRTRIPSFNDDMFYGALDELEMLGMVDANHWNNIKSNTKYSRV